MPPDLKQTATPNQSLFTPAVENQCRLPTPEPLYCPVPTSTSLTPPVPTPAALELFGHFTDEQVCRPPTPEDYAAKLDKGIDTQIQGNRRERGALDALRAGKDSGTAQPEQQLDVDRQQLLDSLNMRSQSYAAAIHDIDDKLGSRSPKNPTLEEQELMAKRAQLVDAQGKYTNQQTALQRWHDRNEINGINEKLKDPALDPTAKEALLAHKKQLAKGLLSTTKHYEQFDDAWSDTVYGKDKSYTTMREAGCGPTGLADLMDFADQEDPEGRHAAGAKDPFNPRKMADYATNHGRVKGSGTSGTVMMNDLAESYPGFAGNDVNNQEGAVESLNNGIPVLFLGHNITGKGADGKNSKPYGGHFMVLNGVSDDGKNFDVVDGGRNNKHNIHSISSDQLNGHTDGYWNVKH